MSEKINIEETLLGALRSLLVGRAVRSSRRRKPRVCAAVEMGWREHEHCDEECVWLVYEDGTEEMASLYADVEIFNEDFVRLRTHEVERRLTKREKG